MTTEIVTQESTYPWNGFDRAMDALCRQVFAPGSGGWKIPAIDIEDSGKSYRLSLEVPGLTKEELQLKVQGSTVEIRGAHQSSDEEKSKNYLYRERIASELYRSVELPEPVRANEAKANLANGLLVLELPKLNPTSNEEVVVPVQ